MKNDNKCYKCRWTVPDLNDDSNLVCINSSANSFQDVVNVEQSPCEKCDHYFSYYEDENISNDGGGLL